MHLVELTPRSVAANAALDELLLLRAEEGAVGESFRLWTADQYAVVLGRGGRVESECDVDRCRRDGVAILRRVSGGGTVLQGPGCLNFSLVLSYERGAAYRSPVASYAAILEPIAEALRRRGVAAQVLPRSDLAVAGRKISGNAQARKRRFFLHHGTFLCGFDVERIGLYLKHPPKEPDYREGRRHEDFVTNLPLTPEEMGDVLNEVFRPSKSDWRPTADDMKRLREIAEKREIRIPQIS
ncbi:lipoate--protein ligase family protein [Candidatus Sumerlaeota bacterium]|nr:lipoate--protein ligase family protein [Candidatus Sumerlaeota bacterium]